MFEAIRYLQLGNQIQDVDNIDIFIYEINRTVKTAPSLLVQTVGKPLHHYWFKLLHKLL